MACHLLRIRDVTQLETHPLRGALFENYVVEEGTELWPIELKSGQTFSPSMLDALGWWCRLAGESSDSAMPVYGGNDSWELQGMTVRPWFTV